jgi:hypothetical protein
MLSTDVLFLPKGRLPPMPSQYQSMSSFRVRFASPRTSENVRASICASIFLAHTSACAFVANVSEMDLCPLRRTCARHVEPALSSEAICSNFVATRVGIDGI